MLNYDEISSRIWALVSAYVERFGLVCTGLYRFPDATKIPDWTIYLTVVNITLNRADLRPAHLWIRNGNDYLLLLCVSGYFRPNMDEVADTLSRLWIRRAPHIGSPILIQAWRIEAANINSEIGCIYQTLGQITSGIRPPYRKRGFGCSFF